MPIRENTPPKICLSYLLTEWPQLATEHRQVRAGHSSAGSRDLRISDRYLFHFRFRRRRLLLRSRRQQHFEEKYF